MQIDTSVLFPLLSLVLAIGTFLIGRNTNARQKGAADGELKADIKYIKNSVEKQDAKLDGIVKNYDDVKLEIERLKSRLEALEKKVNYMHPEGGQL